MPSRQKDSSIINPAFHNAYLMDEAACLIQLRAQTRLSATDRETISQASIQLIKTCRDAAGHGELFDVFLQEYGLSTEEGVTLMRLAEALIRTPDDSTAHLLIRDKLADRDWKSHEGNSSSGLVNLSTGGMALSAAWIKKTGGSDASNLLAKMGDVVLHKGVTAAMGVLSGHFVLGRDIGHALQKSNSYEKKGFAFSYDMLGESAHTIEDAERYRLNYQNAISEIAKIAPNYDGAEAAPGISIKLSALHPRYEYTQRETCIAALIKSIKAMALTAKAANAGLTIDAEEADRLEISLLIAKALIEDEDLADWNGFTMVVQAYQRRAPLTIETLLDLAKDSGRKIAIRLVKGAYWDMEIKRAQEMGLSSYPVFTRKENTDVSYLACARLLLDNPETVYPQFATHNAATAAAVIHMAGQEQNYEFQRLHGMGEVLHLELMKQTGRRSRIYAPVGAYKELLPYLVRRLLENGANSSFVNQFLDEDVDPIDMARDPIEHSLSNAYAQHPSISDPRNLFGGSRLSAKGLDITQAVTAQRLSTLCVTQKPIIAKSILNGQEKKGQREDIRNPANLEDIVGGAHSMSAKDLNKALAAAKKSKWKTKASTQDRSNCLLKAADALEAQMDDLMALCVREAGKTWADARDEVREAVDFCRYYALQALKPDFDTREPLGTIACISPWNFPLAIFLGQVTASLAAGNAVICKPAEQTPLIAYKAVKILHESGVPPHALHLAIGPGAEIGAALVASKDIDGICFTGSTLTAKRIAASLADTNRPLTPLIAETGGLNAMIVDSTALLEQAVSDVVASSFQSAGQRCSACRLVCLQDDIADDFIKMLAGSMEVLNIGDPDLLSTDVGPVINQDAHDMLTKYANLARDRWKLVGEFKPDDLNREKNPNGFFFNPLAFEIPSIDQMDDEKFGPILHIIRFKSGEIDALMEQINALGYGLTMGLHTRIDGRIERITELAEVGNLYVNRNQIGAVVGVQPFGGDRLSGTGPKAGGPLYMKRLSRRANRHEGAPHTPSQALENGQTIMTPINLPGPTGEENRLSFQARGRLVIIGASDLNLLTRQVFKAIGTGNEVLIFAPEMDETVQANFLQTLLSKGAAKDLIRFSQATDALAVLDKDIEGVISDGPERNEVARQLCLRPGAILPILSVHDDIERYIIERTRTVDTTAAGGNASLLAM